MFLPQCALPGTVSKIGHLRAVNRLVKNLQFMYSTCTLVYSLLWRWQYMQRHFYLGNVGRIIRCGRVTHICVDKLTIIRSDNGLSPHMRQAIIGTNARILLIGHVGTNFSEISTEILTFSLKKMCVKASSAKWRPFCRGLNVLIDIDSGAWWPSGA